MDTSKLWYPSPQSPTPTAHNRGTCPPYHAAGMTEDTFTYNMAGPGGTGGGQVILRMPEPSSRRWGIPLPEYCSIRSQFVTKSVMGTQALSSNGMMTVNIDFVLMGGTNMIPAGTHLIEVTKCFKLQGQI